MLKTYRYNKHLQYKEELFEKYLAGLKDDIIEEVKIHANVTVNKWLNISDKRLDNG